MTYVKMQTLNQCTGDAGEARMCGCQGGEKEEDLTTKSTKGTKNDEGWGGRVTDRAGPHATHGITTAWQLSYVKIQARK